MKPSHWFLIATAFLAGCSAGASDDGEGDPGTPSPPPDGGTPEPPQRLTEMHFQVEADSPLAALATRAAAAWSKALGVPVTATPEGDIPMFVVDAFEPDCAEAVAASAHPRDVDACSQVLEPANTGHTEVLQSLVDKNPKSGGLYQTILHEMGHHLSGRPGHLPESSNVVAIMRAIPYPAATLLTQDDIDWVCQGPRMACQLPSAA